MKRILYGVLSFSLLGSVYSSSGTQAHSQQGDMGKTAAVKRTKKVAETTWEWMGYQYARSLDTEEGYGTESPIVRILPKYQKFSKVYDIFAYWGKKTEQTHVHTISPHVADDIDLFLGEHAAAVNVFNQINRTRTTFGAVRLQEMLVRPTTDIGELERRQKIIATLQDDEQVRGIVTQTLDTFAVYENSLLSFWDRNMNREQTLMDIAKPDLDEAMKKFLSEEDYRKQVENFPILAPFIEKKTFNFKESKGDFSPSEQNKNLRIHDAKVVGAYLFPLIVTSLIPKVLKFVLGIKDKDTVARDLAGGRQTLNRQQVAYLSAKRKEMISAHADGLDGFKNLIRLCQGGNYHFEQEEKALRLLNEYNSALNLRQSPAFSTEQKNTMIFLGRYLAGAFALSVAGTAITTVPTFMRLKKQRKHIYLLQKLMDDIRSAVHEMTKLGELFATPELQSLFPEYRQLQKLQKTTNKADTSIAALIDMLNSPAITSKSFFRYYTTVIGKITASYMLMRKVRYGFAGALRALGQLDAYMSMVELIEEHRDKKNKYTLVMFERSSRPHLKLSQVWNPLLESERAIGSDFELGGPIVAKDGLVSGPNAGGKSTVLKAITLSLVMAQTFGFAPAAGMQVTPFTKINTYLNITDDVAQGRSQFAMEVYRAKELTDQIKSLARGEFAFTIMDELFSGTNPSEGQAAAYSIVRSLNKADQSILLVASHYPVMQRLEKDTHGRIKNFKVTAAVNPISYPYTLVDGASNQKIALDILREEGFAADGLLDYAQDIVDNPEKYSS